MAAAQEVRQAGSYYYFPSEMELFAEALCQDFHSELGLYDSDPISGVRRHSPSVPILDGQKGTEMSLVVTYDRPSLFYEGVMGRFQRQHGDEAWPEGWRDQVFSSEKTRVGIVLDPDSLSFVKIHRFLETLVVAACKTESPTEKSFIFNPPPRPFKEDSLVGVRIRPDFLLALETPAILSNRGQLPDFSRFTDQLGISWTGSLAEKPDPSVCEVDLSQPSSILPGCRRANLRFSLQPDTSGLAEHIGGYVKAARTQALDLDGTAKFNFQTLRLELAADPSVTTEAMDLIRSYLRDLFTPPSS